MEFDKNKIKLKIAISKIKKENDIVMESKTRKVLKTIGAVIAGVVLSTGVVFAGTKVYESIWKEPKEYATYQEYQKDTELKLLNEKIKDSVEIEKAEKNGEVISEDKAIEIANNIAKKIGVNSLFTKESIRYDDVDSKHSKDLYYVIRSSDSLNTGIEIKLATNGELYSFVDYDLSFDYNVNTNTLDEKEIENKTSDLLTALNLNDKYVQVKSNEISNYNGNNEKKELWSHYIRNYSGITNSYDNIDLYFYIINNELKVEKILTVKPELDIDNNEILIEKEQAIDMAKSKDRQISELDIDNIDVQLEYRPLNSFYYIQEKSDGTDDGLIIEKQEDGTNMGFNKFSIEDNILRKVYNVKISYVVNYTDDEPIHDWKEQFGREYYVDATTGEIIGGRWGNNLD